MPQIQAFGKVMGIRSPRKEASALRKLASSAFAISKALDWDGEYELAEFHWNRAANWIDAADRAEQDKRRFFIRQDTWTAPAENAGSN